MSETIDHRRDCAIHGFTKPVTAERVCTCVAQTPDHGQTRELLMCSPVPAGIDAEAKRLFGRRWGSALGDWEHLESPDRVPYLLEAALRALAAPEHGQAREALALFIDHGAYRIYWTGGKPIAYHVWRGGREVFSCALASQVSAWCGKQDDSFHLTDAQMNALLALAASPSGGREAEQLSERPCVCGCPEYMHFADCADECNGTKPDGSSCTCKVFTPVAMLASPPSVEARGEGLQAAREVIVAAINQAQQNDPLVGSGLKLANAWLAYEERVIAARLNLTAAPPQERVSEAREVTSEMVADVLIGADLATKDKGTLRSLPEQWTVIRRNTVREMAKHLTAALSAQGGK